MEAMRERLPALVAAALVAALCCLSLAPARGDAETLRAKSVLPPGQSGYVSIPGLADGTGSPHLTDQVGLFEDFRYKPAGFGVPGTSTEPMPGVEIVRDPYGVPQITGETDYDAWWGVGYAVAQDRLFQLELFRRATSGRLAELLGGSYLDDDIVARRDYYTDAEIDRFYARLPRDLRERSIAYRDGINAWIDYVRTHPTELPGEFVALGTAPEDWTIRDSMRIGVFLARTVPSGDGNEIPNAAALRKLGSRGFNTLHPVHSSNPRITIPRSEAKFPSQPGRTRRDERIGFRRSKRFVSKLPLGSIEDTATDQAPSEGADAGAQLSSLLQTPGGSFMWAIRDPERDRAYLYNGPQLGFSIPELFVEFEVHSPSTPNLRGVSAAGVPVVGIGHNDHVAWGFTSGLSDEDDLYVERLTGEETYRFRGEERPMSCRDERFVYREAPTGLPGLVENPGAPAGAHVERICRTVHGPVQARGEGIALARRYAIWKRDLETFVGIDMLNEARNIGDVDDAMREVTWNENVVAADSNGSIGYWHPGLHPLRPERWDERLPYPGGGGAEWRGLLPRAKTPHVINPARGWVANWNNLPAAGWTNGDGPARERLSGRLHRVGLLEELVGRVARSPSYARSTRIVRTSGTTAQQRPLVSDRRLALARDRATGRARATLAALIRWDGDYARTRSDGTVDPGVAIWERFKADMQAILVRRLGGAGGNLLAGETGSSHVFDATNGEAQALIRLGPGAYAKAARRTTDALRRRFGTASVGGWREPRRRYEVSAQGAAQAPDLPFFDRGTWEQSVEIGRGGR
ncbi:hypothetical protein HJD18_13685 [Thermoleophilia bacterium SCSIO 60948]|nr:hypothetical protein HJD18_13685 [Thermoleophilia bacterium SCSIO 60948]